MLTLQEGVAQDAKAEPQSGVAVVKPAPRHKSLGASAGMPRFLQRSEPKRPQTPQVASAFAHQEASPGIGASGSHATSSNGKATAAANYLYQGGKQLITEAGHSVAETWKSDGVLGVVNYTRSMFWVGKATEEAGKGLKWFGKAAEESTKVIDAVAKRGDHGAVVKGAMGMTAGLIGFVGGLASGIGSLAEWSGKISQGDKKTLAESGHAVLKIAESFAYIDGKSREAAGSVVASVGDLIGSSTVNKAGQAYSAAGRAEQSLASDSTKKVVDTIGQTSVHYLGKLGQYGGKALSWLGEKAASATLNRAGQALAAGGQKAQRQTENALTKQIGQFVDERGKEYKDHGSYAITRDITRAVGEIASLFVNPEALVGKAGEAAKGAEVAAETMRGLSKTADVVSDVGKIAGDTKAAVAAGHTAETVAEAGHAIRPPEASLYPGLQGELPRELRAGLPAEVPKEGPKASPAQPASSGVVIDDAYLQEAKVAVDPLADGKWHEYKQGGEKFRQRRVPSQDGIPEAWTEIERVKGDPQTKRVRQFTDPKTKETYAETILGDNRWTVRQGLKEEAAAKGAPAIVAVPGPNGPIKVKVYGAATADELAMIEKVLNEAPPAARKHASDIYLNERLGKVLHPDGTLRAPTAGFAGDGSIILDRTQLIDYQDASETLFHEMGHNLDTSLGKASKSGPWGQGASVSDYGSTHAVEDFAEAHRVVLEQFPRLSTQAWKKWLTEPYFNKKVAILRHYGVNFPSGWTMRILRRIFSPTGGPINRALRRLAGLPG